MKTSSLSAAYSIQECVIGRNDSLLGVIGNYFVFFSIMISYIFLACCFGCREGIAVWYPRYMIGELLCFFFPKKFLEKRMSMSTSSLRLFWHASLGFAIGLFKYLGFLRILLVTFSFCDAEVFCEEKVSYLCEVGAHHLIRSRSPDGCFERLEKGLEVQLGFDAWFIMNFTTWRVNTVLGDKPYATRSNESKYQRISFIWVRRSLLNVSQDPQSCRTCDP